MNTIVDTAPPPAPQLPRIEPTDILRAAGHMGIGTAAGHALATQLMAAAALARTKGAELSHRMRTEAQENPHRTPTRQRTQRRPLGIRSRTRLPATTRRTPRKNPPPSRTSRRHRRHDRRRR